MASTSSLVPAAKVKASHCELSQLNGILTKLRAGPTCQTSARLLCGSSSSAATWRHAPQCSSSPSSATCRAQRAAGRMAESDYSSLSFSRRCCGTSMNHAVMKESYGGGKACGERDHLHQRFSSAIVSQLKDVGGASSGSDLTGTLGGVSLIGGVRGGRGGGGGSGLSMRAGGSRVERKWGGERKKNEEVAAMESSSSVVMARKGIPAIPPSILTPAGVMDINSVLLQNRIVFLGSPVDARAAQRVITQLIALAANDSTQDIKLYINSPGGSIYSIMAVYDCMSFIKPDVSTICLGLAASQSAILLAGGTKGKRFAMPNARIMIHQPQGGSGGTIADVRRQAIEVMSSRDKIDKMYQAFTGQTLEKIQMYTDRDRFFSAAEAMEFGLIDGVVETQD